MPRSNNFQHQTYSDGQPKSDYKLIPAGNAVEPNSVEFRSRMQTVGDRMRRGGVGRILIVHGSFVGQDPSSIWSELSRWRPGFSKAMLERNKTWVDSIMGDNGNYTPDFADRLNDGLNRPGQPEIHVELFNWSGENHHIGRADGAIRLLDHLLRLHDDQRVVLWGHSHAGNVFALLTNLIAASPDATDRFFQAAEIFFRSPQLKTIDVPVWQSVRHHLADKSCLALPRGIDIATFGTPIRYGWEARGYDNLLHFIHHRPSRDRAEYLADFPPEQAGVLRGTTGDIVQQIGIAGTNVAPSIAFWRTWSADRALNALLQPDHCIRRLRAHLKCGMRVAEDGVTLLTDYGEITGTLREHHAGHAVYTLPQWLVFHAEQIAAHFYG